MSIWERPDQVQVAITLDMYFLKAWIFDANFDVA